MIPEWRRKPLFTDRAVFLAVALAAAGVLVAAWLLETVGGMEPCPLCWVQRGVFALLAVVALVAALHGPRGWGRWVYAATVGGVALAGVLVAARHIQIQLQPPVIGCGVGWETLVERLPWHELLTKALAGTADCANVDAVMGLPLPVWTLGLYLGLGAAAVAGAARSGGR